MNKPKLIIIVGNIASGKTTWIKNFLTTSEGKDFIILSKDDLRSMIGAGKYIWNINYEPIMHTIFLDCINNFMAHDINIIIDATNMSILDRNEILNFTKKKNSIGHDYQTIAVVMPILSEKETLKRKKKDKRQSTNIWRNVYNTKEYFYEEPTNKEGFDEIWEIR